MAKRRVYWDSCAFLGLINGEAAKQAACRSVWNDAEKGYTEIYTSFFTFAEVYKAKCEGKAKPLVAAEEAKVVQFLQQEFIIGILVDEAIGIAARTLMRQYTECKKPSDAIHLASALRLNVDEMHTYDGSDLLKLSRKVHCQNGDPLMICPPSSEPKTTPTNMLLFGSDKH